MSDEFFTTGDLKSTEVDTKVRALAEALAKRHGVCSVSRESSGIQIYFACPRCLEIEGSRALQTRKFSVNASKYLGLDKWASRRGTYIAGATVASCLKCKKIYQMEELLTYPLLSERGYKDSDKVYVGNLERKLVPDGKGNMVPPGPGKLIPITSVAPSNPGRWYLEHRGYDLDRLWKMFQCCWCFEELPESEELRIFYKRLPLKFRSTPQGRIIFFASINGAIKSWQGRIPEYKEGHQKWYWHPYEDRWVLCELYNPLTEKWEPTPQIQATGLEWDLPKYRTAKHAARAEVLMGYDAAKEFCSLQGISSGFLVEGPLDAGNLGPGTVGMTGTYLSDEQAALLMTIFKRIVFFPDKGEAGKKGEESVRKLLEGRVDLIVEHLPANVGDPGELTRSAVDEYRRRYLN